MIFWYIVQHNVIVSPISYIRAEEKQNLLLLLKKLHKCLRWPCCLFSKVIISLAEALYENNTYRRINTKNVNVYTTRIAEITKLYCKLLLVVTIYNRLIFILIISTGSIFSLATLKTYTQKIVCMRSTRYYINFKNWDIAINSSFTHVKKHTS